MKRTKSIFVIMPFQITPTRNRDDLTAFFEYNVKLPIESYENFTYNYIVRRSDDTFNINEQIIRDLYSSDIVICDLSGHETNPNVMYELGVRLGISDRPVILIREQNAKNKPIFDIGGFYAFEYNPHQYTSLEKHLIDKIQKFESRNEEYISPVLKVLETSPQVIIQIAQRRAENILSNLSSSFYALSLAASSATAMFLEDFGERNIVKKVKAFKNTKAIDILNFIIDNDDELLKLNWNNFQFHPTIPPTLNAYLQEPPLRGILPRQIEIIFNSMLLEYYRYYLSTDYVWIRPRMGSAFHFIKDSIYLEYTSDAIYALLIEKEDKEQQIRIIKFFHENASKTSFVDSPNISELMKEIEPKKSKKAKTKKS